jgi:hypothetical protein
MQVNPSSDQVLDRGCLLVPAKAMLFGEFGVLYGAPALAATLPKPAMAFEWSLVRRTQEDLGEPQSFFRPTVVFESELMGGAVGFDVAGVVQGSTDRDSQKAVLFVSRALSALSEEASTIARFDCQLRIRVNRAFSPALGLGSSSAVLVALVLLLRHAAGCLTQEPCGAGEQLDALEVGRSPWCPWDTLLWQRLMDVLRRSQGRGSGYDMAIQCRAAQWFPDQRTLEEAARLGSPKLWSFMAPNNSTSPRGDLPQIEAFEGHPFWLWAGWLLPSGQAADTGRLLAQRSQKEEIFAASHGDLARRALDTLKMQACWCTVGPEESNASGQGRPTEHPFAPLMDASLDTAIKQGIAAHLDHWPELSLMREHVAYKTMGAGCGDSLWVVPRRFGPLPIAVAQKLAQHGALSLAHFGPW